MILSKQIQTAYDLVELPTHHALYMAHQSHYTFQLCLRPNWHPPEPTISTLSLLVLG